MGKGLTTTARIYTYGTLAKTKMSRFQKKKNLRKKNSYVRLGPNIDNICRRNFTLSVICHKNDLVKQLRFEQSWFDQFNPTRLMTLSNSNFKDL
jgi:hypothetical protein